MDAERPSERAMRLATECRDLTKKARDAASVARKWGCIPISETGQAYGPIWWFKTRKAAIAWAVAESNDCRAFAIARYEPRADRG